MTPEQLVEAVLCACFFVMVSVCCSAEAAYVSANRAAVRALASQGSRNARIADQLLSDRAALLARLLIGVNVFTVGVSVMVASLARELWGPAGTAVAAPVLVILLLVFGEIVPKQLAYADPTSAAVGLSRITSWMGAVLGPVAALFAFLPRWLSERHAVPAEEAEVSQESLEELLRLGEEGGSLPPDTGGLVAGILNSGDRTVREIMIPAQRMVIVRETMPLTEAAAIVAGSDYSRLPVFRSTADGIVGTLHAKDVAAGLFQGAAATVADVTRPVLRVGEGVLARDLLAEMRRRRQHMAVVADSRGGVSGLVTMHDLIEEVIGEINETAGEGGPRPARRSARRSGLGSPAVRQGPGSGP